MTHSSTAERRGAWTHRLAAV